MEPPTPASSSSRPKPHAWQEAAAERVLEENVVVAAETGAGKTLVACLAAQRAVGRGKVAFIVPVSRLLAHQQFVRLCDFLATDSSEAAKPRRVVEVTGYTASAWGEQEWRDCRERFDVFVGTAEIFRQAFVDSGFLKLQDFSLIVVDECHHVGGNSGVAEIMMKLHFDASTDRRRPSLKTRVLGLTASIAEAKAETRNQFEAARQDLLDAMQAIVEPCRGLEPRVPPIFKKITVGDPPGDAIRALASQLCDHIWEQFKEEGVQKRNEKSLQRVTGGLASVLCELGKDAFIWAVEHGVVAQIQGKIDNWQAMLETQGQAQVLQEDLDKVRSGLKRALEFVRKQLESSTGVSAISEKVLAIAKAPLEDFGQDLQLGSQCAASGMFFVNEVALAGPLAFLLQSILGQDVDVASGVQSMCERARNSAFQRFRSGRCRLLVCTACAEEGVDVSSCAFVARFSQFSTTRSHVQGAGRARLPGAVIYYMENDPPEECHRAGLMREVAEDASLPGPSPGVPDVPPGFRRIPGAHPFVVPETGAEVNVSNAKRILQRYLCQVTRGEASLKAFHGQAGEGPAASHGHGLRVDGAVAGGPGLLLPGLDGGCLLADAEVARFWAGQAPPGAEPEALRCYVAVLVLQARGWLDQHNRATRRVLRYAAWPVDSIRALRLSLCTGWSPPGLLGGPDAGDGDLALPSMRSLDGRSTERTSSGTQQVHLEVQRLSPLAIQNTQTTVNKTFSNGDKVMDAMVRLMRREMSFEDFPKIRISNDPESRQWYSADNRRCFVFKVVAPLLGIQLVEVDVINWTEEFRAKIGQAPRVGDVWTTDGDSVTAVREELAALIGGRESAGQQACSVMDMGLCAEASAIAQRASGAGAGAAVVPPGLLPASLGRQRSSASRHVAAPSGPEARVDPLAEVEVSTTLPPTPAVPALPQQAVLGTLALATEAAAIRQVQRALEHSVHPPVPSTEASVDLAGLSIRSVSSLSVAALTPLREGPRAPPVAAAPPEREEGELERVLDLVARSLAKATDPCHDPVSALNLAVQGHFRPHNGEVAPVNYPPWVETPQGKVQTVEVCGLTFSGTPCLNKVLAKRSAAEVAVKELVRRAQR